MQGLRSGCTLLPAPKKVGVRQPILLLSPLLGTQKNAGVTWQFCPPLLQLNNRGEVANSDFVASSRDTQNFGVLCGVGVCCCRAVERSCHLLLWIVVLAWCGAPWCCMTGEHHCRCDACVHGRLDVMWHLCGRSIDGLVSPWLARVLNSAVLYVRLWGLWGFASGTIVIVLRRF